MDSKKERDIFRSVLSQCYANFRIKHQPEFYKELESIQGIVEHSVREHYSNCREDGEEFLNRLVYYEDKEKEDSYIGGVLDGIRLMRLIFMI